MRTMKTAPPGVFHRLRKMIFSALVMAFAALLVAMPAFAQQTLPIDYPARVVVGVLDNFVQPAELGAQQVTLQEVGQMPTTAVVTDCTLGNQSCTTAADGDMREAFIMGQGDDNNCATTSRLDTGQGHLQEVSPAASTSAFVVVLPQNAASGGVEDPLGDWKDSRG